jgi:hypothetical protein
MDVYRPAAPPAVGVVSLNIGGGEFINVTAATLGIPDLVSTSSVALADLDGDGSLDIFIAAGYGASRLLLNNGTGYFTGICSLPLLSTLCPSLKGVLWPCM